MTPSKITLFVAASLAFCTSAFANWTYDEQTDAMTSKKAVYATIESTNSLSLGFPYAGHNPAFLVVRQHPKYGQDVMFRVTKGQILCSSYGGCAISVRFDDKPPTTFSGSGAADHDSTVVFLNNSGTFIANARKAA